MLIDPSSVHRIETHITDQLSGDSFAVGGPCYRKD
jgi:hypothetical protein